MLTYDVLRTYEDACISTRITTELRRSADGRVRINHRSRPNLGPARDDNMGVHANSGAKPCTRTDDAVGPDLDIRIQFGAIFHN